MPSRDFWDTEYVFATTPDKNYTRSDSQEFFGSISPELGTNFVSMINDTKDILSGLPAPNVEVYCIHSSKIPTAERLVYGKGYFPSYDPEFVNGDGDGTVNIRSLEGCLSWKGKQSQPIHHTKLEGMDHLGMLMEKELIENVAEIIKKTNKKLNNSFDYVNIEII